MTPLPRQEENGDKIMNAIKIGLASALAIATAAPALAQSQYQPTDQYRQDQQRYQDERSAYEARRDDYDASRAGYQAARADYERRRADWERARADYDARYGYGAYIRVYGPAPVWDDARWARYAQPSAGSYGRDTAYVGPAVTCRNDHSAATAGAIIGALAGAALGSNVAGHGVRTEGAVLGGVVGAGLGGAVGNAHDKYRCDSRGPYYSYGDTIAYREARDYRSGQYDSSYYTRMRCRLAPAPIDSDGREYRYVRVCPDADGRYRITS
jgi:hypothetical protein